LPRSVVSSAPSGEVGTRARSCATQRRGQNTAGFMLVEVLVALAVVAVALAAIGSLIATTVRGARSLDTHLMLAETARMIATALPDRDNFR
jgi:general secretion pathway protein I